MPEILPPTIETEVANLALDHFGEQKIQDLDTGTDKVTEILRRQFPVVRDRMLRDHPWNFAESRVVLFEEFVLDTDTYNYNEHETVYSVEEGGTAEIEGWKKVDDKIVLLLSAIRGVINPGDTLKGLDSTAENILLTWIRPAFGWSYSFPLPDDYIRVLEFNGQPPGANKMPYSIAGRKLFTNVEECQLVYTRRETNVAMWDSLFMSAFTLLLASKVVTNITGDGDEKVRLLQEYEAVEKPRAKQVDGNESRGRRRQTHVWSDCARARQTPWPNRHASI